MHNKTWQEQTLEYFKQGLSSRKICKKLGWETTKKSTINTFLKPYRDALVLAPLSNLETTSSLEPLTSLEPKERKSLNGVPVPRKPRILFWDLESSLMEGYFFGLWKQNIPMSRVKKQTHLLCASYAFDNEEVQSVRLTPENVKTGDDLDVVVKVIEAIDNCDIMITFNGKKFDWKLLNTRALYWGLPPIRKPKHIDLMEQSKRNFRFPSNSMQNISMYLGEDGKISTSGTQLWERFAQYENYQTCNNALEEIMVYCAQDIEATRDLFKRFQGWMVNVPNLGTITNNTTQNETLRCIHCGSDDIHAINKNTYTAVSVFELYRCGNEECRGVSRITSNGKNLVGVV